MAESNFVIKITPVANGDLDEIYRYISDELYAADSAEGLLNRIEKSIMGLSDCPYSASYLLDEFLQKRV